MNEIISDKIAKLRLPEWHFVQARAKKLWLQELGKRPTFEEVKKNLPNPHTISALELLAIVVLLVLTLFTSYKVGALAIPFALRTLETLSEHTPLAQWIKDSFVLVTAFLFMLLATPSVIYFKLLSGEPEVAAEKKATAYPTRRGARLSLDYLTPRLPSLIVYLSVVWLVVISNQLPGTPFEKFLPVVVEVGLAALVGNILDKRKKFNQIVWDALLEKTEPYDTRLKTYTTDGAYLRLLYQVMREEIVKVKRTDPTSRRDVHVNAWLEAADEQVIFRILSAEYKRLTSGDQFAHAVQSGQTQDELGEVEVRSTLRKPPMGERRWTPETLLHDLQVRGIDPADGYNEDRLREDYDKAYSPRSAWRGGARRQFLGQ